MKKVRSVRIHETGNGKARYPLIKIAGAWIHDLGYLPGTEADIRVGHFNKLVIERKPKEVERGIFVQVYLERLGRPSTGLACVHSPDDVYQHVRFLEKSDRERFAALYLDAKNKMNGIEELSSGTATAALVHPRELYKGALLTNSASVIVAHNHPSGDPTPSREDIELTERLVDAGRMIGIDMLDHLIVGDGRFESLRESGYL